MANGYLSIKYRIKQEVQDEVQTAKKLTAGTYRYFVRGKKFQPDKVQCARLHNLYSFLKLVYHNTIKKELFLHHQTEVSA